MEDKGLQFYEYVKSQGVVVPESFEEFQSGLENPDTAAQFMKYLSTKNIKTPGSVTEFQDVILNNADIPKEDVPEKMSFEELMEKKEKEKEEAEKFRNTPLSPLIPGASKREGEVDLFDEAIIDIDKDFMFREEESVVPELQYRFKDYGFEFDESGLGDMLTVTAPNGEIGEFNLDSSEDANEESLKLKSFLIKNRGSEDVEAIKRIEARQAYETQRFMNQEQVELATKSLNDDMDVLVSEEKDLYNVYQEISKYGEKFEGLTQGDLDDNPELKADYDSYKARVDEFQSMSDVLKNKRGDLIDRRWDLTQSVGAYFDMKKEQGEFSSALYNQFLLGIGDVAATGGDIMIEASIGMSDYGEVSPSVYTEMMLEQALSDKRISKEDYDRLSGMLESEVKPATDSKLDLDEFEKEQERLRLLARGDYEETKKAKGDKRYEEMVSQSDLVLKELKGLLKEEAGEEVLGGGVIKTTTEGVYDDIESSVKDKLKKKRKYGEDGRWKGGKLESIQNGLVELIGSGNVSDEYVEAQQDSFLGGSLLGLSRSLPAMAAGLVSGGATTTVLMGAQINAALKEEMANNPEFDDVSENERMAISAPIAIAAGALESFGIRNMKATSGLINGLVRRAFTKSAGRQLTAKSFDRIIREDIKSGLARGTLKITGAGLAEAETGAAQEFAEVGMKKIYNYIKDEEKFETATGMQWIQDIAMAGAQEAVGGFILGSPGAVTTGLSNTYDEFTNDLPDMVYEAFNIVIGDPNIREGYISSIKSQVADGSLTQEEGDEKIETFKMAGGIAQSIPSDMSMSEKKKAFKLLYERQLLESSIEGKDKSLTKSEQKQINEINKKLETLREGAIKRSTKREKDIETSKNVVEGINKKISEVKEKLEDKSITKKEKDNLQKQLTELENDLKIEEDKSTETDKQEAADIESFFEGTEGEDGPNFAINSGGKSQVLSDKQEAIVNKIKSQVEKVANSLKSRVPGIRILLHENTDDYTKITGKSGGGAYIIEDGKGTIHINLSKARASTLAHEAFHAVFLHKLKTDSNAARAAIAMIKSVEKVLDPNSQLAKDIKAFAALYEDQGEGIQNEEKLAELVGRISSEYKTLSRSAKDRVIDLLKKLANKIGFKFEEGFGKSDQDVIDLLNTLARKFESGEEITEEDVDVIGKDIDSDAEQSTIIRSNKRFQADFTDIESGLTYVYDKNSEEFKRLEKEGYITRDKSINDFNGSFMILHQPDSAFSGTIKKGDTVLVQGKGGVYYPIKFHDKGYFWASTAGAADDLAKSMNKSMDKNGGKIYLALTSAPADKVLSSTNAANGVMELFIALSRDRKLKIRNIRSILINAYNNSKFKEGNKKGGKILTINKNTPMAEVISRISTTLGPEMSVFDERKTFSGSVIKGVVESIGSNKENQEAHNRLADIFGEGMMSEDLIARYKSGSKVSVANLTQAVSQMLTEPILREGKSKTQNGLIYAVLEIDGPVESMEAKDKDDHESYPKTIKSTNNTKSTLHLLTDRVKWQNITIDPKTKDTVNKSGKVLSSDKEKAAKGVMVDRHTQIMSPSAGITLYPLEINTSGLPKKTSSREQKQDTPQTREQRTERLAPNGKRSNLSDVQYDTVRTPAFKKWFGDWENDPKNASKVVDENGEPQVVWRGRDKTKGDVGDIIDIGKTNEGAFFADNKEAADLFMSEFQDINKNDYELIESFLNIRKPEVFNDFWNDFSEARNRSRKGKYTPKKGVDGVIIKDDVWLTQTEIDWKEGQFDEFGNELDEEVIKEIALKGKQFIALDSNQIKLADGSNATFDPDAPSIREDRMVESPSRMTAPQIILEARQNNFSDAAIRYYLIRVRGYSVKQVDEALKFDIDAFESLPQAFRTITGGVVAGLKLYNRVKAYRDKLTKANNKLKNPQLSESEIKAKVAKKLAELKGSVKYGTKTNKQIDDDVRKFRSKEESNNKKRKTKLTAAQVNDRVRAFREKLQADKQAKIDLRNKAITNFEKTERKANEKRKPRMSEQEIMDKAIEFLEKQPEYLAERETYTVGSEAKGTKQTKFREGLTVAQASLVSAFQSNVGVRPTKSVAEKLKKARRMIRDRKKGAIDLNKIKNELRHFIRRSLPNELYKKQEVLKLINIVTAVKNIKELEIAFEQVEKRVTEMNNETLIQKISKMLDLKQYAKKDRNGKIIKGRRIDPETLKRLEGIVANLIDPSMDVDEMVKAVEERVDSLQKQIDELNSKEELSVEDMTKIVDLNIAMQYNQSLLLKNDNIYKTAALDNVHNSLGEIITFGRAVLQDRINKRHKSYVEQLERAYYDITGNKIDMSQEDAKEKLAEMSRGMRNKAKKDRVDRRVRGIFQKLKSSLNGGIQDLSGYMGIISTLPGEMFEGEMQDIVTDRVDASTRMYKGRMLQIKEVLETKLREIYGRGWEKEIQESRKSIEETEAILGYQLSRDEIIYLYNQYRDPSNHSNFEAQYGGKYAEKMDKLFEFLTEEDKAFADYQVNELFPSLYEYYNPIYKRIYDAEMPWSMVYAGPLRYDGGTETPFDLLQGTTSFQKSMAPGSAIKRVNNKRKISEESNINNMFSYIQEMEYWAAYAENLRDINKLFQNDDIRSAITSIHGEKLMKLINESISTISKRGGQVSEFDRFINGTNSLFSITRLALSPVIYLKQLTSAFAYANDIGYRNWAKYSVKNIIEFRKLSKEIMENSVYLKDRYDKSITRTLETYKEENSIFTRPKYFIGDKGISGDDVVSFMMGLVTAGDRHAIIIGGMPNYKLYKDRYMKENPEATEQEAIDYAIIKFEKDTKKAQQSSDLQDKDLTQTGNPIYRSFNMFLTSPKQYLRKELYAIRQIYTKIRQWDRMAGKGTVGQNLRTLTTFHVVLPMIFQYVTSGLPGLLADWEDEDAEDLLRAAILGNINGLFVLGDFFVAAADFAQDKPWAFDFKNLSVFNIMSEAGTSIRRYQKLKPGPKKEEAYWNMIATIAQAKTIRKWITNLQELPDSKNVNEVIMRLLNYSEYQISGGKKSKKSAPKPSEKEKSLAQEISEFQGS